MRLTRVMVEGVGRFAAKAEVAGLGAGVNILSAGNEAGKSTLFRAIRACLFERHGTRNADVAALATEGLALPVSVTLGFEHGGKAYELAKSFIRSPFASLTEAGREIARGRDADERVWELLGIDPGGGRSIDEAAFGLLWVGQGHSFDAPEPQGAAMDALNAAIGSEVETLVGGERARHVLAAVTAELSRQMTDSGKPKKDGPLDRAQRQANELRLALETAETRLRHLNGLLDDLARHNAAWKSIADPTETARLKNDLGEAQKSLKEAEETEAAMARIRLEEANALARRQTATEHLDRLAAQAARIDASRARASQLQADLDPLLQQETETRIAMNKAYEDRRTIDTRIKQGTDQERDFEELGQIVREAGGRDALAVRLAAIADHVRRQAAIEARLAVNIVDDKTIGQLDTIERRRMALDARLEAVAPQVTITNPGGEAVTLNGEAVGGKLSRAVTEPIAIAVGGVTIAVTPPQGELAAARAERDGLDETLAALLARHKASDAGYLRMLREDRRDAEAGLKALDAERKVLGLADAPAVEATRLEAQIAAIDSAIEGALERHGLTALPSPEEIADRRQASRGNITGLTIDRERLDGLIESANAELQRIAGQRGGIQTELAGIAAQLGQDLAAMPDGQRAGLLDQARTACAGLAERHREAAARLDAIQATAPPPDEIERRRNRTLRLREAAENRDRQMQDLRSAIARLEGQIQTLGGEGLGEEVDRLRDLLAVAEAERTRQERRIETLRLLRRAVEVAYAKRREQLNAPLKRHLRPFLHDLFPDAEIDLGDGFRVAGLRRAGPGAESLERLSAGTREQIAVLVRLAMGAMIAGKGTEVPVILDDALVFSDDSRIEQMFDALKRAGQNQQVIVFTCRARSFATLGGRQLTIV